MKKIILLENNRTRQQDTKIDFIEFSSIDNILGDRDCNEILDKFMSNSSIFDKYDVILIHENIYLEDKRKLLFENLEKFCQEKKLVKFSGNNSQSSLNKNILTISSKKIYENIEVYLNENEKNQANILILAYGQYWNLNSLSNTLEQINIFIEDNSDNEVFDFDEVEDDFEFLELKKIISKDNYDFLFNGIDNFDEEINISQIQVISSNLKKLIESKINE